MTSSRRVDSIPSVYRTPSKKNSEGGVRYQNFDTIKLNTCGNCIILLNVLEKWVRCRRKGEDVEGKKLHVLRKQKQKTITEPRRQLHTFGKEQRGPKRLRKYTA